MDKRYLGIDVLTAARQRIAYVFDHFERIYLSFSGGKDSTVMLHLVADEAQKRGRKFGLLFIDLEAQYAATIEHIEAMYRLYADSIVPLWVSLPLSLDNAVSSYEPRWTCWELGKQWVRSPSSLSITDPAAFPFYSHGMEFEEFVHEFGIWYSGDQPTAVFIGIRADESFNRLLKVRVRHNREFHGENMWLLRQKSTLREIYSAHPIYDWRTEDIWRYCGKYGKPNNPVYNLMHRAGVSIYQQRLCQPYGNDQRKGLWLFHVLESETWGRVVARVNGANSGAEFVQYSGNISGQIKISKPAGHTWQSFAMFLLESMPPQLKEHYENKILIFLRWWSLQGGYYDTDGQFHGLLGNGIPNEIDRKSEVKKKGPSWRRICKMLLRHDYWAKGLSFSQTKSGSYEQYKKVMKNRKAKWNMRRLLGQQSIRSPASGG